LTPKGLKSDRDFKPPADLLMLAEFADRDGRKKAEAKNELIPEPGLTELEDLGVGRGRHTAGCQREKESAHTGAEDSDTLGP
jgi:hypothetical protein